MGKKPQTNSSVRASRFILEDLRLMGSTAFLIVNTYCIFLKDSSAFTMFGDLFEEDFSFISNNHYGKGKKSKPRESEPPAPRDFTNLSGIKNQGGTCYLNSLLQTLLFTPEFRGEMLKTFLK